MVNEFCLNEDHIESLISAEGGGGVPSDFDNGCLYVIALINITFS